MLLAPATKDAASLISIEAGLTAIAVAVAFCWPGFGAAWFAHIERAFSRLARRKSLSVVAVAAGAFLLRLAILPLCPIPKPFIHDDFSFLLAADTFASGRLTNPTPAMWRHFETFHLTMAPTYMSMYFPTQGLILAASRVLTGNPWFGILLMTALMCAAICWMLQAWLPPSWALLGGILAILRLGLFSYWINTYTGAGSTCAFAGALVLGALPRFSRTARPRYALLMAAGVAILGTTRLYECLLLCIPVTCYLAWWMIFGKNRPSTPVLLRRAAIPLTVIVAAGIWLGYYNYRAFGSPMTLPYTLDRAQYAVTPYFVWQPPHHVPNYRHEVVREFYEEIEFKAYQAIQGTSFLLMIPVKVCNGVLFFAGIALLAPLIMLRRVLLDHRIRFLVLCLLLLAAGELIQVFLFPHYLAAFTAAFYAVGLQAMRHLRLWMPGGQPVGRALVRLTVTLCVFLAGVRLVAQPLHVAIPIWPGKGIHLWYGFDNRSGAARAQVKVELEHLPGKQLAIVRYAPGHDTLDEWVYNAADIDNSKVVWAREMDEAENLELMRYYGDRTVWLVEPDSKPAKISRYPSCVHESLTASR
jgi:hypothetical protein